MNPTYLSIGAFFVLLVMFAATMFTVFREKRALSRLVQSAVDFDAVKDAITQLPEPHQEIAEQMIEAINVRSTLDEALTKAVVRATNQSFEPPLARRLILIGAAAVAVFAPLSLALVQAADRIVRTYADAQARPPALVYIRGQSQLEAPFEVLHDVFWSAAWLVAGLAIVWALRWWLLRPEIREARFVRALLETATRLRPGTAAPVSARLSELIAPDRGLGRPITASVMWFLAVTLGWLMLYGTATVRAANTSEAIFDVWPESRPISKPVSLLLPSQRAGGPIKALTQPSILIDQRKVLVPPIEIAELDDDGVLASDWASRASDLSAKLQPYKPLEPFVLAHRATLMQTVLSVLHEMSGRYGAKRFHLILARTFALPGHNGGKRIQADLPLMLGHAEITPSLQIRVTDRSVEIVEKGFKAPFSDPLWASRLRAAVRERTDLFTGEVRAPIEVRTSPRITYERFVEVIGAADTACRGETDCGLPGLGLEIVVQPL